MNLHIDHSFDNDLSSVSGLTWLPWIGKDYKIFRHTGDQWSRQSEELPIHRVGDLALLLLTAMKKAYQPNPDQSILNEVVLKEDEMDFLKEQFEKDKERIQQSFLEIKRLLNDFDIENL